MSDSARILDITMCCLWSITYILVLLGSIKYRYPLISPIASLIIAPYEFAFLIHLFRSGSWGEGYAFFSYLFWCIIEFLIILFAIKSKFIPPKKVPLFLTTLCLLIALMCYLVAYKEYVFLFSYVNTYLGILFWFFHAERKSYPLKPLTLIIFVIKFIADTIAGIIYWGVGSAFEDLLCISLPVLHIMFILSYFMRRSKPQKT